MWLVRTLLFLNLAAGIAVLVLAIPHTELDTSSALAFLSVAMLGLTISLNVRIPLKDNPRNPRDQVTLHKVIHGMQLITLCHEFNMLFVLLQFYGRNPFLLPGQFFFVFGSVLVISRFLGLMPNGKIPLRFSPEQLAKIGPDLTKPMLASIETQPALVADIELL